MRNAFFLFFLIAACSTRQPVDQKIDSTSPTEIISDASSLKHDATSNNSIVISTYDDPKSDDDLKNHKHNLITLFDDSVFFVIHAKLRSTLSKQHQNHFDSVSDYYLLSYDSGDFFGKSSNDYSFVVYDNKNARISIVVFRESTNRYFELYRNMEIINGLENVDCNYGSYGTLDYQLAAELIYQGNNLIKRPEKYLESPVCKIRDLAKDDDIILEEGCLSAYNFNADSLKSLCISTSSVYNNWECLKYDESKNIFVIFYGQAFAD